MSGAVLDVTYLKPAFEDARGGITDLLAHIPVDCVTILTSVKGAVRGNHYHHASIQYVYVLSGRLRAYAQCDGQPVQTMELTPGALWTSPPMERHAMEILEDAVCVVMTRGPRGGASYESDTFRVPPLQPSSPQEKA